MPSAVVRVQNVASSLDTDQQLLALVRRSVAYRKVWLPPAAVVDAMREYHTLRGTSGGAWSAEAMRADHLVVEACLLEGVDPSAITREVARLVADGAGSGGGWDGWTSQVSPKGMFPTGLLRRVVRACEVHGGATVRVVDERHVPDAADPITATPVPLYDYQAEAVEAFLASGRGVMEVSPRGGKTRIAVEIVRRLGQPTLFVAPMQGLVDQTVDAFREFLPRRAVVPAHGGVSAHDRRLAAHALVVVATPETARSVPGVAARKVLILDEFHHAAARTYLELSGICREAYWRLGLTGTNYRADGLDPVLRGVLADTLITRTMSDLVEVGRLVPAQVAMLRVPEAAPKGATGRDVYPLAIVRHQSRNDVLAYGAAELARRGRTILAVAKEITHTKLFEAAMIARGIPVRRVDAADGPEAVRDALAWVGPGRVVVGTSVIGEGRDVPAADAMIYLAGGRSSVKVVQDYCRVLTSAPGKRVGIVLDAADDHHRSTVDAAAERLALYRRERCNGVTVMGWEDLSGWLDRLLATEV